MSRKRLTTSNGTCQSKVQDLLEKELNRLKRILETGHELKVLWVPGGKSKLEGEVAGTTILVYSIDETESLKTLQHEVLDCIVSKAILPYKEVANTLITMINERAYCIKEELVEKLARMLA